MQGQIGASSSSRHLSAVLARLRIDKLFRSCFVLRRVSRSNGQNAARKQRFNRHYPTGSARGARSLAMTAPYLAKLNSEQRRAVEHGCGSLEEPSPLLIIAGAGSGKTNTLANRVAHLIVSGCDPRRMMLLTFSRRAAAEMQRRVERIIGQVLGAKAGLMTDALSWSGTFHAIGARLLREYALDIGLSTTFTIHDREDSADLMNLVRHD